MPTISQLPSASVISAADEVPISQGGALRAAAVGTLLASVQSAITLASATLLGRTSIGAGGPEQVDLGAGLNLTAGTLVADGVDHALFPMATDLSSEASMVISNDGTPMLMQASLLRGLFSSGQNVSIDLNGVISATATVEGSGTPDVSVSINSLPLTDVLAAQDLIAVGQSGTEYAVTYGNFIDGMTIDQAPPAGSAADADLMWVAQGANVMAAQTLSAIWIWITQKLPTFRWPVVEITTNTNLNMAAHNGCLLICSQPVTLNPLTSNMGSGFECTVINASSGSVTLGSGFLSSSGSLLLGQWQAATLICASYSGGIIAYANVPTAINATLPGQVSDLASSTVTSSTITIGWQPPVTGGAATSYIVQYRSTGATTWTGSPSLSNSLSYEIVSLQAATSYDVMVQAQNVGGVGAASAVLTVSTESNSSMAAPLQVTGLSAGPTSSGTVQLNWVAPTSGTPATSFTVLYRTTGSSSWGTAMTGILGTESTITGLVAATSYDFEVIAVNAGGSGPASATTTVVTSAAPQSVTSIIWNVLPAGSYFHGVGAIGVNAQVSPSTSPIQFGLSLSATTPPSNWVEATFVNTNLWGAYLATPAVTGNWYVWSEGLDGSAAIVSPSSFVVE